MRYVFAATPEEEVQSFFERLDEARASGTEVEKLVRFALVHLIGVYDRQHRTRRLGAVRLRDFKQAAGEALLPFRDHIAAYLPLTLILAEGANTDEWYELCLRRSVIQLLLEDLGDARLAALIDQTDLADLDAEMRRQGSDWGPLPEQYLPQGLGADHWWWRYPLAESAT